MRRPFRIIGAVPANEQVRFWSRVGVCGPDECWPFDRLKNHGYGGLLINGRDALAHRVAWVIAFGQEPNGLVCHSCDNPACCNPKHLWVGDDHANSTDCSVKRRHRGQRATHCINGHEFTPENTYIRTTGVASRGCRACNRAAALSYKQRRAA